MAKDTDTHLIRRDVPQEHKERIFRMVQGWTDPEQILVDDLDRWIEELQKARAAVREEIVQEKRPRKRLTGQNDDRD